MRDICWYLNCTQIYFINPIVTCLVASFDQFSVFFHFARQGPPLPHHRSMPYIFYWGRQQLMPHKLQQPPNCFCTLDHHIFSMWDCSLLIACWGYDVWFCNSDYLGHLFALSSSQDCGDATIFSKFAVGKNYDYYCPIGRMTNNCFVPDYLINLIPFTCRLQNSSDYMSKKKSGWVQTADSGADKVFVGCVGWVGGLSAVCARSQCEKMLALHGELFGTKKWRI